MNIRMDFHYIWILNSGKKSPSPFSTGFQRYVFSTNAIVWRIQCNLNLSQPPSTPHPLLPLPKNLPCQSDRGIDQSGSLRSESTSHLPSNHMYTRTFFIKIFQIKSDNSSEVQNGFFTNQLGLLLFVVHN